MVYIIFYNKYKADNQKSLGKLLISKFIMKKITSTFNNEEVENK